MERDTLATPAELGTFCAAHGLPGLRFDAAGLEQVLTLREAVRDVCQAQPRLKACAADTCRWV
ncbi:hypothetical protein BJY22_003477 [Kribbella shirazensis]|uniref:Uncharacterized protein n=2 Tax=Kribbella shirazensis TaxID=1105143 RepID=A0A7X5VAQ0_9ACTN|nr:hypothetical protein [Kribbella shirazensis]